MLRMPGVLFHLVMWCAQTRTSFVHCQKCIGTGMQPVLLSGKKNFARLAGWKAENVFLAVQLWYSCTSTIIMSGSIDGLAYLGFCCCFLCCFIAGHTEGQHWWCQNTCWKFHSTEEPGTTAVCVQTQLHWRCALAVYSLLSQHGLAL